MWPFKKKVVKKPEHKEKSRIITEDSSRPSTSSQDDGSFLTNAIILGAIASSDNDTPSHDSGSHSNHDSSTSYDGGSSYDSGSSSSDCGSCGCDSSGGGCD